MNSKKIFWVVLTVLVIVLVVLILNINTKRGIIPQCPDCNIIFIDVDALRADHLGAYGYYRGTSPNIDAFARKSILFKKAYAQGHWSELSIMSILTSALPQFFENRIKQKFSLPNILKNKGYVSAAFTADLTLNGTVYPMDASGFDNNTKLGVKLISNLSIGSFIKSFSFGLDWINKNKNKKFFLYLHGHDTHTPYSSKYENYFDPDYNESIFEIYDLYVNAMLSNSKEGKYVYNNFTNLKNSYIKPEQERHLIAHYDGGILSFDELFESFMYGLEQLGILNKTIIVFFSDHGEDLLENGRLSHLLPSHAVLYVPLIIHIPGAKPKSIDFPVALMDIMPTVLDLTNITTNNYMSGINLIPLIENPSLADKSRSIPGYQHMIKGDWEILIYPNLQLYNIRDDPNESNNLADKRPEAVKELINEFNNLVIDGYIKKNE